MSVGELRVFLERGVGLKAADRGGTSDPYVVVTVLHGGQEMKGKKQKTKVIKKTLNPEWQEELVFTGVPQNAQVEFKTKDKDIGKDDPLGRGVVDLAFLQEVENPDEPQKLELEMDEGHISIMLSWMSDALIAEGLGATRFFRSMSRSLKRDYVVMIDRSGSMSGGLWRQAGEALEILAPECVKADPDGISLYFFSTHHQKYEGIKSAGQIHELFAQNKPTGGTNLAPPLLEAFGDHFKAKKKQGKKHLGTTILVITDGQPSDKHYVKRHIIDATKKMKKDEDLSITFVQIGSDSEATRYLKELDDELEDGRDGAKFDIVDCVTSAEIGEMGFAELIEKSIND